MGRENRGSRRRCPFRVCRVYGQPRTEISQMRDLVQDVLLLWFLTSPLASYYVRLPIDRSVVTYNRLVLFSVTAAVIWTRIRAVSRSAQHLSRRESSSPSSPPSSTTSSITATRFEIAWLMLTALAILSVAMKSQEVGAATKSAVDAFVLPLLAFHFARTCFGTT